MKIIEEAIAACLQQTNVETHLPASRDDLLGLESLAFELSGRCVEVLDGELHAFVGRNGEFRWHEFVFLEAELEGYVVRSERRDACKERGDEKMEWKDVAHAGNLLAN